LTGQLDQRLAAPGEATLSAKAIAFLPSVGLGDLAGLLRDQAPSPADRRRRYSQADDRRWRPARAERFGMGPGRAAAGPVTMAGSSVRRPS
jgi:hypothetical protein